ncbi:THAP domain-containing protein 1 [Monomorium pharaonis]|uniref:THAP domain-containing protein 1 n=1 Tax=Monomorium pharaonis TaxID=307658 RepID=UPI00063FA59A|nr:THAP domain-containing protein 1 [Monomorium pharaonis]XP_036142903.1 THAP domain-containing protein 1 [Monomorium pharaonis]
MTGCCVPGCNNSSRKGFSLRRFPSNNERKALWILKINRKNWKPTAYSHICEVHFAKDMWEKPRIDGKKKLKYNAVPTIFPTVQTVNKNKEISYAINHLQEHHSAATCAATSKLNVQDLSTLKSALLQVEELKEKLEETNEKLQKAYAVIREAQETKQNLLQQIRELKSKRKLSLEKSSLKSLEILRKVFNNDQIKWLQQDSPTQKVHKWSEETIKKAFKLKLCCSENGYKELLNQNIPLPALRTLRRNIKVLNYQLTSDEIYEILNDKITRFQNDREKDCMSALDEISIIPDEQNDTSNDTTNCNKIKVRTINMINRDVMR